MSHFFQDWHRIAGFLLLVLALGVSGAWGRSRVVCDDYLFGIADRQHHLLAVQGNVYWYSWQSPTHEQEFGWNSHPLPHGDSDDLAELLVREPTTSKDPNAKFSNWTFGYWFIATPLTLLSAYLLLHVSRRDRSPKRCPETLDTISHPSSSARFGRVSLARWRTSIGVDPIRSENLCNASRHDHN